MWEKLGRRDGTETPAEEYRRLRPTLAIEREQVLEIRSSGTVDHDVIEEVLAAFDVEESMLTISGQRAEELEEGQTVATPHTPQGPATISPPRLRNHPPAWRCARTASARYPYRPSAHLSQLRQGGVLRFFTCPARDPALPQQPSTRSCVASSRANPGAGAFSTSGSGELAATGDNARASSQDGCISPRQSRLFMD